MIPYELIGRLTVALVLAILVEIAVILGILGIVVVWWRGWSLIANLAWKGYDWDGTHPPVWRRKIAIAAITIQERDKEIWNEAHERLIENDD